MANASSNRVCVSITLSILNCSEALMTWAMQAAQQQHAQAIAEATAAAEVAQKTGQGPKPMMVTPYKHNWVISGTHPEKDDGTEEDDKWFDWDGIVADISSLWNGRDMSSSKSCCNLSIPMM